MPAPAVLLPEGRLQLPRAFRPAASALAGGHSTFGGGGSGAGGRVDVYADYAGYKKPVAQAKGQAQAEQARRRRARAVSSQKLPDGRLPPVDTGARASAGNTGGGRRSKGATTPREPTGGTPPPGASRGGGGLGATSPGRLPSSARTTRNRLGATLQALRDDNATLQKRATEALVKNMRLMDKYEAGKEATILSALRSQHSKVRYACEAKVQELRRLEEQLDSLTRGVGEQERREDDDRRFLDELREREREAREECEEELRRTRSLDVMITRMRRERHAVSREVAELRAEATDVNQTRGGMELLRERVTHTLNAAEVEKGRIRAEVVGERQECARLLRERRAIVKRHRDEAERARSGEEVRAQIRAERHAALKDKVDAVKSVVQVSGAVCALKSNTREGGSASTEGMLERSYMQMARLAGGSDPELIIAKLHEVREETADALETKAEREARQAELEVELRTCAQELEDIEMHGFSSGLTHRAMDEKEMQIERKEREVVRLQGKLMPTMQALAGMREGVLSLLRRLGALTNTTVAQELNTELSAILDQEEAGAAEACGLAVEAGGTSAGAQMRNGGADESEERSGFGTVPVGDEDAALSSTVRYDTLLALMALFEDKVERVQVASTMPNPAVALGAPAAVPGVPSGLARTNSTMSGRSPVPVQAVDAMSLVAEKSRLSGSGNPTPLPGDGAGPAGANGEADTYALRRARRNSMGREGDLHHMQDRMRGMAAMEARSPDIRVKLDSDSDIPSESDYDEDEALSHKLVDAEPLSREQLKRTAQELPEKQRKHKLREQREAARKDLPETAAAAKRAGRKVPVPSAAKRSAAGGGAKKRGLPRSMAR